MIEMKSLFEYFIAAPVFSQKLIRQLKLRSWLFKGMPSLPNDILHFKRPNGDCSSSPISGFNCKNPVFSSGFCSILREKCAKAESVIYFPPKSPVPIRTSIN